MLRGVGPEVARLSTLRTLLVVLEMRDSVSGAMRHMAHLRAPSSQPQPRSGSLPLHSCPRSDTVSCCKSWSHKVHLTWQSSAACKSRSSPLNELSAWPRGPARLEDLELRWAGPRSAASVQLAPEHAARMTRLCILLDVEADAASLCALRAAGSPLRELCLQG